MKKLLILIFAACAVELFGQAPLWDLQKNKISPALKQGDVKIDPDGSVTLSEGSSFAVPASAFPDENNFTVQIMVKYPQIPVGAVCNGLIVKEDKQDSGFGISVSRNPWYEAYTPYVNRMYSMARNFAGKQGRANPEKPVTFTVYAKNGIVSFYLDDQPGPKIFANVIKSKSDMWVGKGRKNFGDIQVLDLKVYGKNFVYKSPKERVSATPDGVRVGKGWNIAVPYVVDKSRPRVLIYGDSISMGYKPRLADKLKGRVYVEHWCHFAGGHKIDQRIYREAAASAPYDVIVFNNGLHSTHWTPDKVTDQQVYESYRDMAKALREGAPQAKIIYLNTTPVNDGQTNKDKPLGFDKRNDVVLRLNKFAAQAMKDEGIQVIDAYGALKDKLDMMVRDGFHWQGKGYDTISDMVGAEIEKELKKRGKLKGR